MEPLKGPTVVNSGACVHGGSGDRNVVYELPLGDAAATFNLEKAVCSHGFFMTDPNRWDPLSKTLQRPLRLLHSHDDDVVSSSSSVTVQISHPSQSSHLLLRVFDADYLSPEHQQSLMDQVRRMLRLSDMEEKNVREFQEMYGEAKASGFGRIFRSPTLFEDMVKCILVCNCQWSRTLTMARALCELQLELQYPTKQHQFSPKTPEAKETRKRNIKSQQKSKNITKRNAQVKAAIEADATLMVHCAETSKTEEGYHEKRDFCRKSIINEPCEKKELPSCCSIGNFPSPEELASLDVNFLAKRCNLGYRASRILGLAKSIIEGRIKLRQLEKDCGEASLSNYVKINQQLEKINGFGPFTCANVLMCMGFYHVVPSDSETLRHLNQVHGKRTTIESIQEEIEIIYGKYAPFQFLVYWSEIWSFYEEKFGKLSEVPDSCYKLITAANMRCKDGIRKKSKIVG